MSLTILIDKQDIVEINTIKIKTVKNKETVKYEITV